MKNSPLPPRRSPMGRSTALTRVALERKQERAARDQPARPRPNQAAVKAEIAKVRAGEQTVAVAARAAACDPTYLADRIWREVKRDVITRDGGCVRCGAPHLLLDVHHRRARQAGGTSDPVIAYGMANLVTLCRTHHDLVTDYPEEGRPDGLVLRSHEDPAAVPVLIHGVGLTLLDSAGAYIPYFPLPTSERTA